MTIRKDASNHSQYPAILVAGGGLAGLTAALAAVEAGFEVFLCSPPVAEADGRTTALLDHSVSVLRDLGVWERAEPHAAALRTMRIIDATDRLIRAPQADFTSDEIGLDAFGYNIENRILSEIMREMLETRAACTIIPQAVTGFHEEGDLVHVSLANGEEITCGAVLAADGRRSVLREAAGIETTNWQHDQVAIVGNFTHTIDHHDTSTEFHTPTGPMTVVPLGRKRSSFVFVENRAGAEALLEMAARDGARAAARGSEAGEFDREIERRISSILGKTRLEGKAQSFPLSVMVAKRFGAGRILLIGEAGHVFPPIGAQGFNLGLRDASEAVAVLTRSASKGFAGAGEEFARRRASDIRARTLSVDILNRSLLSDFLPIQIARSFGLYALSSIPPLRRLMMREGVAPGKSLQLAGRLPFKRQGGRERA